VPHWPIQTSLAGIRGYAKTCHSRWYRYIRALL
jgi:hypothetical protein